MRRTDNVEILVLQIPLVLLSRMVASANDITIHRLLIQCEQQLTNVNEWSDGDKNKYALVSYWIPMGSISVSHVLFIQYIRYLQQSNSRYNQ